MELCNFTFDTLQDYDSNLETAFSNLLQNFSSHNRRSRLKRHFHLPYTVSAAQTRNNTY